MGQVMSDENQKINLLPQAENSQEIRIDKWLWSVRVYKTRSQATNACRGGAVEIEGVKVKPSHNVKINEIIHAKVGDILKTVRVWGFIERRVSASVAKGYAEDLTPPTEYQKHREPNFMPLLLRPKGAGRPTKKDRREIDRLKENHQ
jgi:ribosome-associated heat shock protein Hsp15